VSTSCPQAPAEPEPVDRARRPGASAFLLALLLLPSAVPARAQNLITMNFDDLRASTVLRQAAATALTEPLPPSLSPALFPPQEPENRAPAPPPGAQAAAGPARGLGPLRMPPPLTPEEKFHYAVRKGFGLQAAISALAAAGYQQAYNKNPGFGQGLDGYFSRAGSSYGNNAVKRMVGSFALAALLQQDPRYIRSGRGSTLQRSAYAVSRVLIAYNDYGGTAFNYSRVGGALAAGQVSNAWRAPEDGGVGRGLGRAGISLANTALWNVLREFWPEIRRIVRR